MTPLARPAGVLLAAATMAILARASTAPIPAHPSSDAVLRLAWSARPERIERCRERTAEELARLPAHMRQPVACEGTTAEYRLLVRVDGVIVADRVVHGGGLRRDRRLYVFQELALPPGEAQIDVRFDRVNAASGSAAGSESGDREIPEGEPRHGHSIAQPHGEAIPRHVSLTRPVSLSSRRVLLVTYDAERRELTAVDGIDHRALNVGLTARPAYNSRMTLLIVFVVLAVIAVAVIGIYNGLVRLNVQTSNAWADIDVQLKRRHDLIPNVVETVKGYAAHERQTLEAVINARNRAVSVKEAGPAERAQAEGALVGALRGLFALAEAYPQLRAAENFAQLQGTLSQIEDAIQNARRYYNAVVRDLNTRIQQFPSNLVAGTFGFRTREFFEIPDGEKAVPQVKF